MANPGSGLYGSVELSSNTGYETGESPINKALRRRAFASSPMFNDYTVENLIKLAKQVLNSKSVVVSGNKQFPEFDLNYKVSAPDITQTPSGGGGLPGTGFTPNIASPGAGNGITPSALPDIGLTVEDLNSIRTTPVVPGQTDGTQNPADSKVGVEVGDSLSMGSST